MPEPCRSTIRHDGRTYECCEASMTDIFRLSYLKIIHDEALAGRSARGLCSG